MSTYSKEYRHDMRVRIDYNNMLTQAVGEHGIDPEEIADMQERMQAAFDGVNAKRDAMRWRDLYKTQLDIVDEIEETAEFVRNNCDNFVVLGIGGSALGPIAVHQALRHQHHNALSKDERKVPRLYVEDNVDPERMAALLDVIDLDKTIFNVITKSGSTSETMAQLLIITRLLIDRFGEDGLRDHLIATTDKEKGNLIIIAKRYNLRTFIVPDGVGGRFSELCPVGLIAAAVCGADIRAMLAGAEYMDELCSTDELHKNPALMLAVLEVLAMERHGANISVLMPYADSLKFMADWYAQLWAESLGKKKLSGDSMLHFGQTPVKALGVTDQHSQVQIYTDGPFDKTITFIGVDKYRVDFEIPHAFDDIPNVAFLSGHTLNELIQAERIATEHAVTVSGHMNKTIMLPIVNEFTIGQLIMLFELQTAFAGELLGIDAFDQPGVEEGKNATYALLGKAGYEEKLRELQNSAKKEEKYII
ncbi:MAG: glucose-6-phosphate isomerase [Christensenellaceae bacterium]|nr:glucose-6-phosphate isomerase [Christensenellaceae bacterium]